MDNNNTAGIHAAGTCSGGSLGAGKAPSSRSSPSPISPSGLPMSLKAIVVCNGCNSQITQVRWKCLECPNVDLCVNCKEDRSKHPLHSFVAVPLPSNVNKSISMALILQSGNTIVCDACSKIIRSVRWKCSVCPDYDMCHSCYLKGTNTHQRNHSFYGMYLISGSSDDKPASRSPFGLGYRCDGCEEPITKVRFHCSKCPDYDLCWRCIRNVSQLHDSKVKNSALTKHDWILHIEDIRFQYSHPDNKSTKSNGPSSRLSLNYHCSRCNSLTAGTLYRCDICPSYVVCHTCYPSVRDFHENHIFSCFNSTGQKILVPCNAPVPAPTSPPPPNNGPQVVPIVAGKSNNPNIFNGLVPTAPNVSNNDGKSTTSLNYKVSARCNGCGIEITEVHYKCGLCLDYDLCEMCERNCKELHHAQFPDHPFVKFYKPLKKIVKAPLLDLEPISLDSAKTFSTQEAPPSSATQESHPQTATNAHHPTLTASTLGLLTNALNYNKAIFDSIISKQLHGIMNIPKSPKYEAKFVEDVNISDGTEFVCGTNFTKIWSVVNTGTEEWPQGVTIQQTSGYPMNPIGHQQPLVPIGRCYEKIGIAADMTAPAMPGRYRSLWRLKDHNGNFFGDMLWCDINVDVPNPATTSSEPRQQQTVSEGALETIASPQPVGNTAVPAPYFRSSFNRPVLPPNMRTANAVNSAANVPPTSIPMPQASTSNNADTGPSSEKTTLEAQSTTSAKSIEGTSSQEPDSSGLLNRISELEKKLASISFEILQINNRSQEPLPTTAAANVVSAKSQTQPDILQGVSDANNDLTLVNISTPAPTSTAPTTTTTVSTSSVASSSNIQDLLKFNSTSNSSNDKSVQIEDITSVDLDDAKSTTSSIKAFQDTANDFEQWTASRYSAMMNEKPSHTDKSPSQTSSSSVPASTSTAPKQPSISGFDTNGDSLIVNSGPSYSENGKTVNAPEIRSTPSQSPKSQSAHSQQQSEDEFELINSY
ncbi:hypothetical protein H4219_001983 [Mycoemilia scoparia]|uniref:ZZ-type domain-containing protein n=1 Tax=Mycoemilia scoparia TaxID=417184 RepID=A0A9W8DVB9_9FUNG|nr:hypothetical protein H4219_001983 [Mycoemilia scoparia]